MSVLFEIQYSVSDDIRIVEIFVKNFATIPSPYPEKVPVRRFLEVGAVVS
jgi:hypothetical protein